MELRALTLEDVAGLVGFSASVISRVLNQGSEPGNAGKFAVIRDAVLAAPMPEEARRFTPPGSIGRLAHGWVWG